MYRDKDHVRYEVRKTPNGYTVYEILSCTDPFTGLPCERLGHGFFNKAGYPKRAALRLNNYLNKIYCGAVFTEEALSAFEAELLDAV